MRRAPRGTRSTFNNTLDGLFPFATRLWLHLLLVAVVGSAAVMGSGLFAPASLPAGLRASAEVKGDPRTGTVADALLPAPVAAPTALAANPNAPAGPVSAQSGAAASHSEHGAMMQAMSLGVDGQIDPSVRQDGVVAVRALASSRGGMRLPGPTPTSSPTPTPSPSPTPTPKKEPLKPMTYKVVAGDTLLGIAYKFGITPETVLWANDLGNGELIQIGQEIVILPVSGVLHKVKKGDTVLGIAEAYGAETGKVVEANLLSDANMLQEGQVIIVPGGMMRTTEITGLPSAPSQQELVSAPKYTVKEGDTLLSIADAYGVRASIIQVANGLMDPDMLKIGQELAIPGGRAPSRTAAAPRPQPAPVVQAPPTNTPVPPRPTATPKPASQPQPAPPPPSGGSKGDLIAALSQKYLGYRYVWGGTSPRTGFDCSGFTWYVTREAGVAIPRAPLEGQIASGPRIGRDQLLPGDLVFWQNTYKAGLSHVGIYLGGGRFIHAETEATGVQIRSMNEPFWASRYVGAARPW